MTAAPADVRLTFISALRGLAALVVLVFHLQLHVFVGYPARPIDPHSLTWWLVLGFVDAGKFAVVVFFLVSGYLIPSTLRRPGATLTEFAAHRVMRLYPAYWVSIALALAAWVATGRPAGLTLSNVLANLTMFQRFVGQPDLVGVYWTLQIELAFYLCCGALAAAGLLERGDACLAVALGAALAVAAARALHGVAYPVALPLGLAVMFLGDRLRRAAGRLDASLWWRLGPAALAVTIICLVGYGPEGPRYALTYLCAIGAFVLAWRSAGSFDRHAAVRGAARFLGDISYGVYLTGAIVMDVCARPVLAATGSRLAATGLVAGATVLLALAIFHAVEAPGIRLGRWLGSRLTERTAPLTAPP